MPTAFHLTYAGVSNCASAKNAPAWFFQARGLIREAKPSKLPDLAKIPRKSQKITENELFLVYTAAAVLPRLRKGT